ncbi:MAG: ABC transporter substrate-binding protein, partial [Oscillospiraceae bacterium]|nr:ABC transporter substrate-binding protein [Oscillospiraceae bacterium]
DMTGREIALNGDVTRVVALTAADCEILYAVGAGDALVGRGEYCDYPEAALSLPAVQSGAETNIEQIIALSPQVVFMGTMAQSAGQVAQLEAAGIQVVVSEATDLEGVYESISVIGRVMNRESEAADVIAGMKQTFQKLSDKAAAFSDKPTVYFEISPLKAGLWTAGKGTFMDEAASLLGAQNVFGDVAGWAGISEEQVIQRNPGYIVTTDRYVGTGPTPEQEIAGRPGWEHLSAVKDGHILNLADDSLVRPGPRLADGVKQLYDFLYAGK